MIVILQFAFFLQMQMFLSYLEKKANFIDLFSLKDR